MNILQGDYNKILHVQCSYLIHIKESLKQLNNYLALENNKSIILAVFLSYSMVPHSEMSSSQSLF